MQQKSHILRFRLHRKLKRGLELTTIRQWVEEGKLSKSMNNCGTLGFNICQVSHDDYDAVLDWDRKAPEPVISFEPYEEELRKYIVSQPLQPTLGVEFADFNLYEDEQGNTGELYTTPVGQIDILYRNEKNGDFLVIELKRTVETPDSAVGQIAR